MVHAPFTGFAWAVASKFEFSNLNGNLMLREIHPLSVSTGFNSDGGKPRAGRHFLNRENNDGLDHNLILTITSTQ
jgi:hypothetical protein